MPATSENIKIPPQDIEAERSVLGAVLIDSGAMNLVAEFLKAEYFYEPANKLIYSSMLSLLYLSPF